MLERERSPRILVVDDEQQVIHFVKSLLERENYSVVVALNGSDALDLAVKHSPEMTILDISLPDISGLEVCRKLRNWYRGPILVLSGLGEETTVVAALDSGADDYLTKPFRPGELLARMRALLRRSVEKTQARTEIQIEDLKVDLAKRRVHRGDQELQLTRTEFDVLAHLARNLDAVVTTKSILERVWGPYHGEYAQTLRVHVGHIRKKIEADPAAPRYLLTEAGVGYRLTNPSQGIAARAGEDD